MSPIEKTKKTYKFTKHIVVIVVIISMLPIGCTNNKISSEDQDIVMIAHALGGIDNKTYMNSKEGFEYALSNGITTFEADFNFTSDGILVLRHSWKKSFEQDDFTEKIPVFDEFISTPMFGKYTPLSFEDLLYLMNDNKEIYVVTDTKYSNKKTLLKEFEFMVDKAKELELEEVLDRLIIQIYNKKMLSSIQEIHTFKQYIFTLYKLYRLEDQPDLSNIVKFCKNNNIKIVTIPKDKVNSDTIKIIKEQDIAVYTHTINTIKEYNKFKDMGVSGFYTDYLTN